MSVTNSCLLFVLSLQCFFWSFTARADIGLDSISPFQEITSEVFIAEVTTDQMDFESFNYQPVSNQNIQNAYTPNALWIKLNFKNSTSQMLNKVLYFSSPLIGKIELYRPLQKKHIQISGTGFPLQGRTLQSRLGAFDISFGPNQTETFYIRRISHHSLNTKIFLADHETFQKTESRDTSVFFFYFGGILCLFLFNLIIGIYTSEKSFLLYSFFAITFGATALTLQGAMDSLILTGSMFLFSDYLMFFSSLSLISAALFVSHYLELKKILPKLNRILYWIIASAIVSLIGSFFVPFNRQLNYFGFYIDFLILTGTLFFIWCGIKAMQKGSKIAIFFLISWLFILGGLLTWFASLHGFVPSNQWTEYSLLVANMGEMLILSLGLAFKINTLDQQKQLAEIHARDKDRYHRLVKVLSHDIANAVTLLSSYANKIKNRVTDADSSVAIEKIIKNIKNLKDMLYLVRSEEAFHSFKETVQLKPILLSDVASEIFHFFEDKLNEKKIKFVIEIENAELEVMADRTALINQVVANLVSNSIKFSNSEKSIYFKAFKQNSHVHLQIKDEGVGINPKDIENIFFTNNIVSSKGTAKEEGTGLGTSLVREYIAIFNGTLLVESVLDSASETEPCGTTVTLIFPIK